MTFFERPISLSCMLIALALMLYPVYLGFRRKRGRVSYGDEG